MPAAMVEVSVTLAGLGGIVYVDPMTMAGFGFEWCLMLDQFWGYGFGFGCCLLLHYWFEGEILEFQHHLCWGGVELVDGVKGSNNL